MQATAAIPQVPKLINTSPPVDLSDSPVLVNQAASRRDNRSALLRALWIGGVLLFYLVASAWQLGLPGLHYDEAREAGQNAMELLTGAPVTAFRDATVSLFGVQLPLMVQDYIGALNVYLALPLLALSGIGVPNLRVLGILTGLATLLLLERTVSTWGETHTGQRRRRHVPLSAGGLIAVTLAATSPSFIFWSRQGIFVTNLAQPFVLLCIWQGLRWLWWGERRALWLAALAAGLALYAKLLAVWVIAPFALLMLAAWLAARRKEGAPRLTLADLLIAAALFLLPLLPLLLFNLQTGGTWATMSGNAATSYYGVNNRDLWANLLVRLPQIGVSLEGSQFWYLGAIYANRLAPWIALGCVAGGLLAHWRMVGPALLLVALVVLCSIFTVSDLFITHYALLLPLFAGLAGSGAAALLARAGRLHPRPRRLLEGLVIIAVVGWSVAGALAVARYHVALAQSGGLADHSDGSYDLAYALRYNGMGAPIALDWGMDATVRYLSQGTVTPIEIFGYTSPAAPDDGLAARLAPYLDNGQNIYLLHAPGQEVFRGRRAVLEQQAAAKGLHMELIDQFSQRDGTPLYEIWRAAP